MEHLSAEIILKFRLKGPVTAKLLISKVTIRRILSITLVRRRIAMYVKRRKRIYNSRKY